MRHNDDAYATILLMSQVTPHRDELVRPLSAQEYYDLRDAADGAAFSSLGRLIDMDMSGMTEHLGVTEQEAYRLCMLLGRTLPLSISMENFLDAGIDIVTIEDRGFPENMRASLQRKTPPMLYFAGRLELLRQHSVAVIGAATAKGNAESSVRAFVRAAVERDYVIVTDGMEGLSRIAEDEAFLRGGRVIEVLADAMNERVKDERIAEMIGERRALILSQVHPDTPPTRSHALQRNKCIYALSHAAVIFAADEGRGGTWDGAVEALRNRFSPFIYAWDTSIYSGNHALIARGATAYDGDAMEFEAMSSVWDAAGAEQTCMFDWGEPRAWQ